MDVPNVQIVQLLLKLSFVGQPKQEIFAIRAKHELPLPLEMKIKAKKRPEIVAALYSYYIISRAEPSQALQMGYSIGTREIFHDINSST